MIFVISSASVELQQIVIFPSKNKLILVTFF